jgi:integrase
VKQAVDAFVAKMRERGCTAGTIETAEYRLEHLIGVTVNGHRPLRWLVPRGQALYDAARAAHANDTHHNELALGKALGKLALKERWLRVNPFADVESVGRKRHGSTKPRLTTDESRRLAAHCHEAADQGAVVTLAYLLFGARASEMIKRDVRDLDDNCSVIRIRDTKTPSGDRGYIIPDELRPYLRALAKGKKPGDPIFTKDDGSRATRHWANYHVKRLCKAARVPVLPPQALRRTNADMAEAVLESAVAVSVHMGHATGGRAAVTDRSYVSAAASRAARQGRAMRVLQGGQR